MIKRKIVAIACSTGGPKVLQTIIPGLPTDLKAPVLVVQHMPEGFTKSLSDRLDSISRINVSEAVDHEEILSGHVYIAKAGRHLKVRSDNSVSRIVLADGEIREGVKPCANYMYESLADSNYDEIICVVLTGMGSDGAEGIKTLSLSKKIKVIIQDKESSAVFGMPGSILKNNIECSIIKPEDVPDEIVRFVEE